MHRDRFYTLSASCPDQVGIIARVSGFIAQHGGWLLESSFHADALTGRYFMRIEIKADSLPFLLAEFRERFRQEVAEPLQMTWQINDSAVKRRVVVLVSQAGALPVRPAGALAGAVNWTSRFPASSPIMTPSRVSSSGMASPSITCR